MYNRLNQIPKDDWPQLALRAKWSSTALAKLCQVSPRTLERYFIQVMGQCPRCWLNAHRQKCAREMLLDGASVKEVAAELGYKHANNFSRHFRKHHGYPPIQVYSLATTRIPARSAANVAK